MKQLFPLLLISLTGCAGTTVNTNFDSYAIATSKAASVDEYNAEEIQVLAATALAAVEAEY